MLGGCCEVWWAHVRQARQWHLNLLDDIELERRARLKRAEDRDRSSLGAALLRLVVARNTGLPASTVHIDRTCAQCGDQHGRPVVVGSGIHASVSHAGDWVAVAVTAAGPIGVDVEAVRAIDNDWLVPEVLSPAEFACVSCPKDIYRWWTRKEAVVKATGDGIGVGLSRVVLTEKGGTLNLVEYPGRPGLEARVIDLKCRTGHVAALAVLTRNPIEVTELPAVRLLVDCVC